VSEVAIRPMTEQDVPAAVDLQIAAFGDLDRRLGIEVIPATDASRQRAHARHAHFVAHDPAGAWVATVDDRVVGSSLASRRDDLWGLSLLAVDPGVQSGGIGRRLLQAALGYGRDCARGVIESSEDARAMRAYGTSGFALFPQVSAKGHPVLDGGDGTDRVRVADSPDPEFADAVDRVARGAAHGPDHALIASWSTTYVVDDAHGRGYAYLRDDKVVFLLAASDADTARALIRRCFEHAHDAGAAVEVHHLAAGQQWAIDACLAARLSLKPDGPVFWRGAAPPSCYLPSGAFL
jgi:GNAT superfamily N-acetyltransferase